MAIGPAEVAKLRADAAMLRANRNRIREQLASGELIRREEFYRTRFTLARRTRDALLAAPNRRAAELAAELQVDPWLMYQVLNAGVRHLLELATGKGPFPEPEIPDFLAKPDKKRAKKPRRRVKSAGRSEPKSVEDW